MEMKRIKAAVFVFLLLAFCVLSSVAETDHQFKIIEAAGDYAVSQSEAEQIALQRIRISHPRIVYSEESNEYLFNPYDDEPDKTSITGRWLQTDLRLSALLLENIENRPL